MNNILKEIDRVRQKLKKGVTDSLLQQKPFAEGMYLFSMFIINYYSRVRENIKIDYDSFMIVQTVVSSNLYKLNKKKDGFSSSYYDLEVEWNIPKKISDIGDKILNENNAPEKTPYKLTVSSICLVTSLPKETVRRKVSELVKKNLLKNSKNEGILLGPMYKKVFQEFVPQTTIELAKLLKEWEKSGILKYLLNFKV